MAAMRSGINRMFPIQLPGPYAFYDGDSMTLDESDNIETWNNRLGAAYALTGATAPNEPVAVVNEAFNSRQCATFTGTQVATSSTLKTLFAEGESFTAYFAVQYERDETAVAPNGQNLLLVNDSANEDMFFRVQRDGTGPYTYRVYGFKRFSDATSVTSTVQNLAGSELASDKLYICARVQSTGDVDIYVNTISNTKNDSDWNNPAKTFAPDGPLYIGNDASGNVPHHGPIGGIYLYDEAHTTAQIQSMIEGWMPSYFGKSGDPIAAVRGMTYIGEAEDAAVDSAVNDDIEELTNAANLVPCWNYDGTDNTMTTITANPAFTLPADGWSISWQQRNNVNAANYAYSFSLGEYSETNSINVFTYLNTGEIGKVHVQLKDSVGTLTSFNTTLNTYSTNYGWVNYTLVYSKLLTEARMWIDGASGGVDYGEDLEVTYDAAKDLRIGHGHSGAGGAQLNGAIREFAIFGRTLQRADLYHLGKGGSPLDIDAAPQLYVPMDSSTAEDYSGLLTVTNNTDHVTFGRLNR